MAGTHISSHLGVQLTLHRTRTVASTERYHVPTSYPYQHTEFGAFKGIIRGEYLTNNSGPLCLEKYRNLSFTLCNNGCGRRSIYGRGFIIVLVNGWQQCHLIHSEVHEDRKRLNRRIIQDIQTGSGDDVKNNSICLPGPLSC